MGWCTSCFGCLIFGIAFSSTFAATAAWRPVPSTPQTAAAPLRPVKLLAATPGGPLPFPPLVPTTPGNTLSNSWIAKATGTSFICAITFSAVFILFQLATLSQQRCISDGIWRLAAAAAKGPRIPARTRRATAQVPQRMSVDFEVVWKSIEDMRKEIPAAVDTMGCDALIDTSVEPRVQRYQILISLMLSSQTRDEVTAQVMRRLRESGLTMERIAATPEDVLATQLRGVSFHHRKAAFIKAATSRLLQDFQGDVPDDLGAILALPGVGPKMAHLFLQAAFGRVEG
eukprot:EG_transcript_21547